MPKTTSKKVKGKKETTVLDVYVFEAGYDYGKTVGAKNLLKKILADKNLAGSARDYIKFWYDVPTNKAKKK